MDFSIRTVSEPIYTAKSLGHTVKGGEIAN